MQIPRVNIIASWVNWVAIDSHVKLCDVEISSDLNIPLRKAFFEIFIKWHLIWVYFMILCLYFDIILKNGWLSTWVTKRIKNLPLVEFQQITKSDQAIKSTLWVYYPQARCRFPRESFDKAWKSTLDISTIYSHNTATVWHFTWYCTDIKTISAWHLMKQRQHKL